VPCLVLLLALAVPRLVILGLWLFTAWFAGMFASPLWPVLGFVFAPTTLLWYSVVQQWFGGEWSLWPVVGLVVAILIDLSPASKRRRAKA
jgi:hypothetical protein